MHVNALSVVMREEQKFHPKQTKRKTFEFSHSDLVVSIRWFQFEDGDRLVVNSAFRETR